jgi:hypothetical protein
MSFRPQDGFRQVVSDVIRHGVCLCYWSYKVGRLASLWPSRPQELHLTDDNVKTVIWNLQLRSSLHLLASVWLVCGWTNWGNTGIELFNDETRLGAGSTVRGPRAVNTSRAWHDIFEMSGWNQALVTETAGSFVRSKTACLKWDRDLRTEGNRAVAVFAAERMLHLQCESGFRALVAHMWNEWLCGSRIHLPLTPHVSSPITQTYYDGNFILKVWAPPGHFPWGRGQPQNVLINLLLSRKFFSRLCIQERRNIKYFILWNRHLVGLYFLLFHFFNFFPKGVRGGGGGLIVTDDWPDPSSPIRRQRAWLEGYGKSSWRI